MIASAVAYALQGPGSPVRGRNILQWIKTTTIPGTGRGNEVQDRGAENFPAGILAGKKICRDPAIIPEYRILNDADSRISFGKIRRNLSEIPKYRSTITAAGRNFSGRTCRIWSRNAVRPDETGQETAGGNR